VIAPPHGAIEAERRRDGTLRSVAHEDDEIASAAQGDGEVNNQAIESAMRELRLRICLHKRAPWRWPMAETESDWIVMGIDADLDEAFRIAT